MIEPSMRSCAWTVLAWASSVVSSAECTSHVGVVIAASSSSEMK
jgi:hypothetical protein